MQTYKKVDCCFVTFLLQLCVYVVCVCMCRVMYIPACVHTLGLDKQSISSFKVAVKNTEKLL